MSILTSAKNKTAIQIIIYQNICFCQKHPAGQIRHCKWATFGCSEVTNSFITYRYSDTWLQLSHVLNGTHRIVELLAIIGVAFFFFFSPFAGIVQPRIYVVSLQQDESTLSAV